MAEPEWGETLLARASAGLGDALVTVYAFLQTRGTSSSTASAADLAPAGRTK